MPYRSICKEFSRHGSSGDLLANLKRQRIGDLLVSHIPQDEALLLKNGRYACTVCRHKPIFDTLDTLAFHRKGKKHLLSLSKNLEEKEKYITRQFQKENNKKPARSSESAIKPTSQSITAAYHPLLKAKPYCSVSGKKRKISLQKPPKNTALPETKEVTNKNDQSVLATYVKSVQKKASFTQLVKKAKLSCPGVSPHNETNNHVNASNNSAREKKLVQMDEEIKRKADYYLSLRTSGWKKDWTTGKWIRDEEAEFESDDEEPCDFVEKVVASS